MPDSSPFRWLVLPGLFLLALSARPPLASEKPVLRVAAASDLKFVLDQLAASFEKQTGTKVEVTYGSSGNFYSQIQNGAPFDLFFSADSDYPRKLESAGFAAPGSLTEYAVGRIVVWMPARPGAGPAGAGLRVLLDPGIQKIAIANPDHAPYGRAALAALRNEGIYEQVKSKLVLGENVSQAAQFVESGSAQAGILAFSLALSPALEGGRLWEIPSSLYPPLDQAVVLLKQSRNPRSARALIGFVQTREARKLFASCGFALPGGRKLPPEPGKP